MKLITLALCAFLAGCGSTGRFDNRLTLTLDGSRAFVTSLYGPIGVTAELSADDARELHAMREKARVFDVLRSMQGKAL